MQISEPGRYNQAINFSVPGRKLWIHGEEASLPNTLPGRLIVIEGGDGTGKSTQALMLKDRLSSMGVEVLHIREPGSTPLGERIRKILIGDSGEEALEIGPESEMLLYMACRAELFKTVIIPALRQGAKVILERSYFSTYAYQGTGLGVDGEFILRLGDWVTFGVEPVRVILLDMDIEKSLARLGTAKDRIERRSTVFHEKVRKGYMELARRMPRQFRIVDADGEPEEVEARIYAELSDIF